MQYCDIGLCFNNKAWLLNAPEICSCVDQLMYGLIIYIYTLATI